MSPTSRSGRAPLFVSQLHRAIAQRGTLDPVYQELSDHWTATLQRLYPVWALIGPGLSDPGHIEIHSRQIYLDSDTLLGTRDQILAGELEHAAVLRCFGVALHETFHAKHTKRWAVEHELRLSESEDPRQRQLAIDRQLLEEPRMEAHGVRDHPSETVRGRFVAQALTAAVTDVILPAFAHQTMLAGLAGRPVTRDLAGRATVYLQARTHYGVIQDSALAGLRDLWRQVLGDPDLAALDDLFAKVIWIADGDLDALDQAARDYRAIIGPADPADGDRAGQPGAGEHPGRPEAGQASPADATGTPSVGSLNDALAQAIDQVRDQQVKQLDADQDLGQVLNQAARTSDRAVPHSRGAGTGRPSGRMPDRGVDRPPVPDEIQHARRYATRLRQALTCGTRRIDKRTPAAGLTAARTPADTPNDRPADQSPRTRGKSPGRSKPRSRSPTSAW